MHESMVHDKEARLSVRASSSPFQTSRAGRATDILPRHRRCGPICRTVRKVFGVARKTCRQHRFERPDYRFGRQVYRGKVAEILQRSGAAPSGRHFIHASRNVSLALAERDQSSNVSSVGWVKPPGPAGACHWAGQRPDPVGRPDDRLRVPTKRRSSVGTARRRALLTPYATARRYSCIRPLRMRS